MKMLHHSMVGAYGILLKGGVYGGIPQLVIFVYFISPKIKTRK